MKNYKKNTGIKQAFNILNYHRYIESICHFDDVSECDKRIYLITINLKSNIKDNVMDLIYSRITKSITGTIFPKLYSNCPGLCIFLDYAGTRYKNTRSESRHYHGILTIPKEFMHDFEEKHNIYVNENEKSSDRKLICALENLKEVADVSIIKIGDNKSVADNIDYSSKLWNDNSHEIVLNEVGLEGVYPKDIFQNKKPTQIQINKRHLRFEQLLEKFIQNPCSVFTSAYVSKHRIRDYLRQ